jgi:hypothetical protein
MSAPSSPPERSQNGSKTGLRVPGFLEERSGPAFEGAQPEQIEFAD